MVPIQRLSRCSLVLSNCSGSSHLQVIEFKNLGELDQLKADVERSIDKIVNKIDNMDSGYENFDSFGSDKDKNIVGGNSNSLDMPLSKNNMK